MGETQVNSLEVFGHFRKVFGIKLGFLLESIGIVCYNEQNLWKEIGERYEIL